MATIQSLWHFSKNMCMDQQDKTKDLISAICTFAHSERYDNIVVSFFDFVSPFGKLLFTFSHENKNKKNTHTQMNT